MASLAEDLRDKSREQIRGKVVYRAVSRVLNLAHILQLVVHDFCQCPLPEPYLVMLVHQLVLNVPLYLHGQMYVVHEQAPEESSAYVLHVSEQLPE